MAHHKQYSISDPSFASADIALELKGMSVVVPKCSFVFKGHTFYIKEEQKHTYSKIESSGYAMNSTGSLVFHKDSPDTALLLIDEVSQDPDLGDVPFTFSDEHPYQLIFELFYTTIIPGASKLSTMATSQIVGFHAAGALYRGDFVSYHYVEKLDG